MRSGPKGFKVLLFNDGGEKILPVYCRSGICVPEEIYADNIYEWLKTVYLYKCRDHESVSKQLMSTENRVIVFCDPAETILSCGLAADDKDVANPMKWKGKNLIGLVLMEVRCILKEEWKAKNLDKKGRYIKKSRNY